MPVAIKICGMRERVNIEEIASLKPEYFGFIFYDKSPRYVGHDFNLDWYSLPVKKVGVFLDQELDTVSSLIERNKLDVAQLHGKEELSYILKLKEKFPGLKIWKAFSISEKFDFNSLEGFKEVSDMYLFDTKDIKGGGTGKSFDWEELLNYDNYKPLVLAGGIGTENIGDAQNLIKKGINIKVIDINSKAEVSPGLKSKKILEDIFSKIK